MKREVEIQQWKRHATPEDIEYYECQRELSQELLKSYNNVERIIGIIFFFSQFQLINVQFSSQI